MGFDIYQTENRIASRSIAVSLFLSFFCEDRGGGEEYQLVGKLYSRELVARILAGTAPAENTNAFESGGEKSFHNRKRKEKKTEELELGKKSILGVQR